MDQTTVEESGSVTQPIGEWRPHATPAEYDHELYDVLWIRGVAVGHIESFGGGVYPYIFNHRLGSYSSVEGGRRDVEDYAKLAMPLIEALATRGLVPLSEHLIRLGDRTNDRTDAT